jgi:hypothetical protein
MTKRANRMPPKKNTKRKDPLPPAEEAATDPANELAEPPSSDHSSGDSSWGDDDSDDDDWDAVAAASTAAAASAAAVAAAAISSTVMITMLQQPPAKRMQRDHRTLPRDNRRDFFHADVLRCIGRDFTGLMGYPRTPLHGSQFKLFSRLSRGRFQVLMEDLTASIYRFFKVSDNDGFSRTSIEARLLLPLKTLAYGVPSHTFIDYFQISPQYASSCCKHFCKAVKLVYQNEFLRRPTQDDMKKIIRLHKVVHGVEGLMGSLDSTHTFWKHYPKAWQGSYKGKEKKPSIVMEGACDYHLFMWQVSYGYTGTINDNTILSLSPLLDMMLEGTLQELEVESSVVPFGINGEEFTMVFWLVDRIYPKYSRFVQGIKRPISRKEQKYTAWQEACRKDIERALGVLKGMWQWLDRPILLHQLSNIADRVACRLLLHNMLVTDRVMGGPGYDYRQRYDPAHMMEEEASATEVQQEPPDLATVQRRPRRETRTLVGVSNLPGHVHQLLTKKDRFQELNNRDENRRLHQALMSMFGTE